MAGTREIQLDIDHGITFLLCLFGHDVQHDLYHGHGTGKPRAVATGNDMLSMAGMPKSPGEGLFSGVMKGGVKDENEEIITVQTEVQKCLEIKLALKYARDIVTKYHRSIFMDITGRARTTSCETGQDAPIIFIDWMQDHGILNPGRIVFNSDIIDPFELNIVGPITNPAGGTLTDYTITSGQYEGFTLRLIKYGAEAILQVRPRGAPHDGFVQLNATYNDCIQEGILDQITERCDTQLEVYMRAQDGRAPNDDPNPDFGSFEQFKNAQLPVNTFFYKVATSGILPLVVEKVSGTDLFYDLFKSPANLSLKLPREVYVDYERGMGAFIDNYRANVNNFLRIAMAGAAGGAEEPNINTLTIGGVEPGRGMLEIINRFSGKTNPLELIDLFSVSLQGFLIRGAPRALLEEMSNNLKIINENTKAYETGPRAEIFAITMAINNSYSQSLSDEIIQEIDKDNSPAEDAKANTELRQLAEASQGSLSEAMKFADTAGGGIFTIEPIYDRELLIVAVQKIGQVSTAVAASNGMTRVPQIGNALGLKDPTSALFNIINSVGGPFKNIPKELSEAIQNGKLFSNPPTYVPDLTKIKQNNIPEKKCLTRPDISSAEELLSIIGEMLDDCQEWAAQPDPEVKKSNIDLLVRKIMDSQTKLMGKIFDNEENPTIDMPVKTCTTLKGKSKKNYIALITAFQTIRCMIYIFAILISIANKTNTWFAALLENPNQIINWLDVTQNYVEDLVEIFKLISITTGPKVGLNNVAKANNGFVVGSCSAIALAITEPLLQYSSNRELKQLSYTIEKRMLEAQIDKLQHAAGAPDDTKLVKSIRDTAQFYNYEGSLISKWPAAEIKGVRTDMLSDIYASGYTGETVQRMRQAGQGKYFVNNAVSLGPEQLSVNVYKRNFCPISSIVDAQTTVCNSLKIAKNDGYEFGIQDVSVLSLMPGTTNRLFTYRVRVVPTDVKGGVPTKIAIAAFLDVRNTGVLINMAPRAALTPDWPGAERSPQSEVLGNISLDDPNSPLSARKCLMDLQILFDSPTSLVGQIPSYEDVIAVIKGAAAPDDRRMMMKQILEVSFRKALGDYLQELSTVTEGGGYVAGYGTSAGANIVAPDYARLGLHNDRPAFARAMILSLYGKTGINEHSLSALTVTDNLDRLNYIAAGRNLTDPRAAAATGGRKTRGKKKKAKRGKQTRKSKK